MENDAQEILDKCIWPTKGMIVTKQELLSKISLALGAPPVKCQIGENSVSALLLRADIEKFDAKVKLAIAPFIVGTKFKVTGPHFLIAYSDDDPTAIGWRVLETKSV